MEKYGQNQKKVFWFVFIRYFCLCNQKKTIKITPSHVISNDMSTLRIQQIKCLDLLADVRSVAISFACTQNDDNNKIKIKQKRIGIETTHPAHLQYAGFCYWL